MKLKCWLQVPLANDSHPEISLSALPLRHRKVSLGYFIPLFAMENAKHPGEQRQQRTLWSLRNPSANGKALIKELCEQSLQVREIFLRSRRGWFVGWINSLLANTQTSDNIACMYLLCVWAFCNVWMWNQFLLFFLIRIMDVCCVDNKTMKVDCQLINESLIRIKFAMMFSFVGKVNKVVVQANN